MTSPTGRLRPQIREAAFSCVVVVFIWVAQPKTITESGELVPPPQETDGGL
jgi:hypothetical protein